MAKRGRKKKSAAKQEETKDESATITAVTETTAGGQKVRGRKSQYTEDQKAEFLKSIKNGRSTDLSWSEIYNGVKEQGFKGSLPYLMKMGRDAGLIAGRGKRRSRPAGAGAKRGRPMGTAAKRERPAKSTARNGAGLSDIDRIVAQMVEQRLSDALGRAVATIEGAVRELKSI